MRHIMNTKTLIGRLLAVAAAAFASLLAVTAQAAAPGITGPTLRRLSAEASHISQPDGASVYSWGYGCTSGADAGFRAGGASPARIARRCRFPARR